MLIVKHLSASIGQTDIVQDISFTVHPQSVMMVVGPNGSGKTTLVRAILGQLPHTGQVMWNSKDIKDYTSRALAQQIGVLAQVNHFPYSYRVEDIVALGRYAHSKSLFAELSQEDKRIIAEAMQQTRVWDLRERAVTQLSGGEMQRVNLARVFAQQPQLLILDEPTNHLDIEHQLAIFALIRDWAQEEGHSVLSIVHDLNLAHAFGDEALLLHGGVSLAQGAVRDVLSAKNLHEAYRVDLVGWMRAMGQYWSDISE